MWFIGRSGKNNRNRNAVQPIPSITELTRSGLSSTQNPNKFAIELRDKSFRLKGRLEAYVTAVSWDWNRSGGCGKCSLTVSGNYARFNISADDDIRIWLPDSSGTTATLWYRGYVESANPKIGSVEQIQITCVGYSEWLNRLMIQSGGAAVSYSNTEVSSIVNSILTSYVTPNCSITAGTIQASNYAPDTLSFKTSVKDALDTLSDLLGNVEYGVDANLQFYWYNQRETIAHRLYVGDRITTFEDKVSFKNIANQIYLEGGKIGGVAFTASGSSSDSQNRYGKHELIVSNGSITTSAVASQYISGILRQRSRPSRPTTVNVVGTTKRFEASLPIGAVSIVDPSTNQLGAKYGTVAHGGDGKIYGTRANGGSGQVYGGTRRDQVEFVSYSINPMNGRVDASIQLSDASEVSLASAFLKQLDQTQEALRQRSLT